MRMFRYKLHRTVYLDFWFNQRNWVFLNARGQMIKGYENITDAYLSKANEIIL